MIEYLAPAAFAVASVLLLYGAFSKLRKARVIEDVPTSKIRSAHQGFVELTGITQAQDSGPITAPLTNTPCLWYDYKIERYQGGKNRNWTTIESGASEDFFTLYDATASCLVDPRRGEFVGINKKRWTGYNRHPAKLEETSLLGRLRRQRYRYTERRILSDQPLYAIGWFHTLHPQSMAEQEDQHKAKLIAEWKQNYDQLLERFDTNRDGTIDLAEWEKARLEAARQARLHVTKNYDNSDVHILCKPADGQVFLLSTKDPGDMSKTYRRNAFAMFAGGVLTAGITGWHVLLR